MKLKEWVVLKWWVEPLQWSDMTELVSCENTELMAVGVEATGRAIGGCLTNMVVFSEDPLLM